MRTSDLGEVFVTALVDGDAPRLAVTLDPAVQMRALLAPGPIEVLGADEVAGKFAAWFGSAERIDCSNRRASRSPTDCTLATDCE